MMSAGPRIFGRPGGTPDEEALVWRAGTRAQRSYLLRRCELVGGAGAGGADHWRVHVLGVAVGLLPGLADVNAALKEGAIFNADAGCDNVAGQRTVIADVHAVAGREVPANFAQYHDFPRVDVGGHHAVASNGDTIAGQVDGTFHPPVNVKRLRSRHLALDDQRFTDGRLLGGGAHRARTADRRRGALGSRGGNRWRYRTLRFGAERLRARSWLISGLPHVQDKSFLIG